MGSYGFLILQNQLLVGGFGGLLFALVAVFLTLIGLNFSKKALQSTTAGLTRWDT